MARLGTFVDLFQRKTPLLAVPALALGLAVGTALLAAAPSVSAVVCPNTNDIMTNGFSSPSNFISQVQNGDSSGHKDLAAIFAQFGLQSGDFSNFASSAVQGTDTVGGDIKVGDMVVGTGASSFGRTETCQGANPTSMNIDSNGTTTTIWGNANDKNLTQDTPVTILFDKTGTMQFAVMNTCGNPTKFTPVVPKFSCDLLEKHEVSGQANTFTFATKATATNNATIAKVVYNFGDGSPEVTEPDGTTPTPAHTFTQSATVTVTVFVNLPGNQQVTTTSPTCQTPITVTPPPTPPVTPPTPSTPPVTPPKVPAVLPNTGAGNVVGIFAAVTLGGFLLHRQLLARRR
ncbi:MAG TPA: hypothetical protein VLF40_03385 [Candidatus Saccharimonadales bacterium]|nr:hypothetical protein [Candidatus Saccharimonadales bacterium]